MTEKKPTVRLVETPSQKIINRESESIEITDSFGRKIVLSEPDTNDYLDFDVAVGKYADGRNSSIMTACIIYIKSIDNETFLCPTTHGELKAAVQRIGKKNKDFILVMTEIITALSNADMLPSQTNQEAEKVELKK